MMPGRDPRFQPGWWMAPGALVGSFLWWVFLTLIGVL